jgi:hypothetical protein
MLPTLDGDWFQFRHLDTGLGNRHFEVLHLPGHSPGSIGRERLHELVRAWLDRLSGA